MELSWLIRHAGIPAGAAPAIQQHAITESVGGGRQSASILHALIHYGATIPEEDFHDIRHHRNIGGSKQGEYP